MLHGQYMLHGVHMLKGRICGVAYAVRIYINHCCVQYIRTYIHVCSVWSVQCVHELAVVSVSCGVHGVLLCLQHCRTRPGAPS